MELGMKVVFELFKITEMLMSITCLYYHIKSIFVLGSDSPHEVIFCGTFFCFTFMCGLAILRDIGSFFSYFLEAILAIMGCICFTLAAALGMHVVCLDINLMFLTDAEEAEYPNFYIVKNQSMVALMAGFTFLLHAVFAVDALVIKSGGIAQLSNSGQRGLSCSTPLHEGEAVTRPIRLHLFCKPLFAYLLCESCKTNSCINTCAEILAEDSFSSGFSHDSRISELFELEIIKVEKPETNNVTEELPHLSDRSDEINSGKSVVINMVQPK